MDFTCSQYTRCSAEFLQSGRIDCKILYKPVKIYSQIPGDIRVIINQDRLLKIELDREAAELIEALKFRYALYQAHGHTVEAVFRKSGVFRTETLYTDLRSDKPDLFVAAFLRLPASGQYDVATRQNRLPQEP